MSNILDTYLSNRPVEPEANKDTIIRSMAYYIEAVEYEKEAVEVDVAVKKNTLEAIRAALKVETDADILKEVERLKVLDK